MLCCGVFVRFIGACLDHLGCFASADHLRADAFCFVMLCVVVLVSCARRVVVVGPGRVCVRFVKAWEVWLVEADN